MTDAWVIDSSVGFSWIHPDQATPETNRLLEQVESGTKIFVPVLWFAEIANTLLVFQRRKKLTAEERRIGLETLSKMSFTVDEDAGKAAFGKTSELAEKYDLTVYDATYLEVATRRKLPLASRDNALTAAAKKAGLKVLWDDGLLESALGRPQNLFACEKPTIFDLASAYACGIIRNHPFVDGNKRTGFMAAFLFLGRNGVEFKAEESDVVLKTLAVAAGRMSDKEYATWLREHSQGIRPRFR